MKRSAMLVISLIKDSVSLKVFIIKCPYFKPSKYLLGCTQRNNN